MSELHHLFQRRAGEKDFVYAFATHGCGILVCDGAPTTAEDFNVSRAFLAQKVDNFGEKLDMATVVTGNADRAHVFLDCGAHDVADRSVISQINDLDPVADELEIDRVDGTVVPVTNRHGSQDTYRRSHLFRQDLQD